MLQGSEKILVEQHCLIVAGRRGAGLLSEPFSLNHRVDQFRISGSQFEPSNIQVPLLGNAGDAAVLTCQRGCLDRKIPDKGWCRQPGADSVFPEFLDQLAVPIPTIGWHFDFESRSDS